MAILRRFAHHVRLAVAASLLAVLVSTVPTVPVSATSTIIVNSTADAVHNSVGNSCVTAGGTCSLRDAVLYANNHQDTVITVPPGVYKLTIVSTGSGDATTGALSLNSNVTINGAGASATTIDGSGITDGIFAIDHFTLSLNGLTMTNGMRLANGVTGGALAISFSATATVANCVFSHNLVIGPGGSAGAIGGSVNGGAIYNAGILVVSRSVFTNNTAAGGTGGSGGMQGGSATGGAIANSDTSTFVSVGDSTFTGNVAQGGRGGTSSSAPSTGGVGGFADGGAIQFDGGAFGSIDFSIFGSTFVGNSAIGGTGGVGTFEFVTGGTGGMGGDGNGGALSLYSSYSTKVGIINSTFVSNIASGGNGGAGGQGTPMGSGGVGGAGNGGVFFTNTDGNTVTNVTIDGNSATGGTGGIGGGSTHGAPGGHTGGGIIVLAGSTQVVNTIISNNGASGNCTISGSGSIANGGHNLQFNPNSGCGNTAFTVGDPKLAPLANNGGFTQTREILPGSAALDAGDDTYCGTAEVNSRDQRGIARPQGPHCDIGAYEEAHPNPQPAPKPLATSITQTTVAPQPQPIHPVAPTPAFAWKPQPQPSRH